MNPKTSEGTNNYISLRVLKLRDVYSKYALEVLSGRYEERCIFLNKFSKDKMAWGLSILDRPLS